MLIRRLRHSLPRWAPKPSWSSRTSRGLYEDWPNSDEVISRLTASQLEKLLPELSSGMVPKMEGCLHAVRGGVNTARVIDGRVQHSILLEIFTDEGIGTMVVPDEQKSEQEGES
jgi:acetylglutamate kinase